MAKQRGMAGRPGRPDARQHRLNIPPDLWMALRVQAAQEGTSVSKLVQKVMGQYLALSGVRLVADRLKPRRARQK